MELRDKAPEMRPWDGGEGEAPEKGLWDEAAGVKSPEVRPWDGAEEVEPPEMRPFCKG